MRTALAALVAVALGALGGCGSGAPPVPGVGELREVARSPDRLWTGVAVSPQGRVFVCYPRWIGPHAASVEERYPGGRARPYPAREPNLWRPGVLMPQPFDAWVCVQSVRCDGRYLYVLDSGNPGFGGVVPDGCKLARLSLSDDRMAGVWHLGPDVAPARAYLNDVRVAPDGKTAYLTDSGLGALVVLDLETGVGRRVLSKHASVLAEPDVTLRVEGRELRWPAPAGEAPVPMRIHADGLTLDPTGAWLYWQVLSGRTLWRAPTAVLRDPARTPEEVAASVERVATTVAADGLEMGADGTIYFAAIEQGAIVARRPDGTMVTLVTDPRLAWPDSLALSPRGTLYVTASQIHRTPLVHGPMAMPTSPFLLLETGALPPAPPAR
ncbi:MAG: hypothetical protein IT460_10265 [Planctomycetes bacterium]|nr:hypothetical protein [Planctomycetota bacterium]